MGKDIPGDHNPEGSHRSCWDSIVSPGGVAPHDFDFPAQQSCKTPGFLTTHGKVKITPEFPDSGRDREFPTSTPRAELHRVGTGGIVSPPFRPDVGLLPESQPHKRRLSIISGCGQERGIEQTPEMLLGRNPRESPSSRGHWGCVLPNRGVELLSPS